jgi:hypothetical protein
MGGDHSRGLRADLKKAPVMESAGAIDYEDSNDPELREQADGSGTWPQRPQPNA